MYSRRPPPGFGKPPAAKPLKRPTQARAVFTVQAIYDAFVRIWRRDGWDGVSTRAVALETGISVGTLYDYFPNKAALLSGYVRHCMEQLLRAIEEQAVTPPGLSAEQRLRTLVRLACGADTPELPWFDAGMLALEAGIAEGKHHRRVHEELLAAWTRVFDACTDLPQRPSAQAIQAMHLSVWGGRRYGLLIGLGDIESAAWAREMERLCLALAKSE
ncbi:TetR/AcrR family transcriptional regulator [Polaromonas sp. JS666]|uniref:TetR/AcrR family transcriptional regulator n=1 Tax=Polaromonas sp. (strain JS666 / ATCC BAA-500) TaxID=296591 RepID=UPI0008859D07|nr:TetR/AcrR family transcriptional regulator [Polaromonas sp. JS666]SDN28497.1 DNA-binding transcriptional regulator, AcrR family [Polaromonas sp. JS666]